MSDYNKKWFTTFVLNLFGKIDPVIREALRQQELGALEENTLLPEILPIQIIRIGNIAIAGIPTEITTIAHNRLQTTLLENLKIISY